MEIIRNPFAFYFPVQKGFSWTIQATNVTGPYKMMFERVWTNLEILNLNFLRRHVVINSILACLGIEIWKYPVYD